ncbi:MAG: hypothetical protein ACRDWH_01970 [Acidimicrobiia bacterium]
MSELPFNPNISQLKRQAKDLKRAAEQGSEEAIGRVIAAGQESGLAVSLRSAQLTIAREHGFSGWQELIEEVGERMVDERDVHRWFGVHLNNEAWNVIDEDAIGPDAPAEAREVALYRAFASAFHWRQVGTPIHHGRGEHLLSRTAAIVGEPELALHHASRYLEIIAAHPDLAEDWDHGFAHEAMARALAMAGRREEAVTERREAERLCALIADDEDRAIVEAELKREPWFGI